MVIHCWASLNIPLSAPSTPAAAVVYFRGVHERHLTGSLKMSFAKPFCNKVRGPRSRNPGTRRIPSRHAMAEDAFTTAELFDLAVAYVR